MSYRNALSFVGTFRSAVEAEAAKGVLAAVGVDSLIRSDNAGGMYPSLDATELVVRAEDAAKAKEALARVSPAAE